MGKQKSNWGGARPGAGIKPKWNAGETKPLRLPVALHDDIIQYARLVDNQFPCGLQVSTALSCDLPRSESGDEPVTQSRDSVGSDKTLDSIAAIIQRYRGKSHPTSVRWQQAKKLLDELESVMKDSQDQ